MIGNKHGKSLGLPDPGFLLVGCMSVKITIDAPERLRRAWDLEKAFEARQQRLATIEPDQAQP
jgi:hypothetical protein